MSDDEVSEGAGESVPDDVKKRRVRRKRAEPFLLDSGSVAIRVRGTRPNGTKFTRTQTFGEGSEADRWTAARNARPALWRWAEEVEAGVIVEEESVTLATAMERLRKEGVRFRAADRSAMKRLKSLGGVDLRELTDARMALWSAGQQRDGKSASYIRYCYSLARRIVSECVARKWIRECAWSNIKAWLPAESKTHTRKAPTDAEMQAVLTAAKAIDERAPLWNGLHLRMWIGHHIAARPVEICRLGPIDLVAKGSGQALRFQAAKGGEVRVITIPEEMAEALREQWAALPPRAQRLGLFFPKQAGRGLDRWVSRVRSRGGKRGAGYETGVLLTPREVDAVRAMSGFEFVPYHLRHGGITSLAKVAGMGLSQLQAFTKHKSQRMLTRYASPQMDEATEAALSRSRTLTPTPTPAMVIYGGEPGAPKLSLVRESAAPVVKVTAGRVSSDAGPHRGRAVGAAQLERWRAAIAVLRKQAGDVGSVAAWVAMRPDVDVEAVAEDLQLAISTGRLAPAEKSFAVGVLAACVERLERVAPTPKDLPPVLGVKKATFRGETKGLRMVRGSSFTLTNGGSSEDE